MSDMNRRDAMGMAFGTVAAVGGVFALAAMKKTWDPLPSVKAAGKTVVDVSKAEENVLYTEKWRGKPVFILKIPKDFVDKQAEIEKKRNIVINGEHFAVMLGLCTHLGCIPSYRPDTHDFLCPCHGGEFTISGIDKKSPPPLPLEIPPFKIDGTKLVLGEAGPEYKKLKEEGVIGKQPLRSKLS